MKYGKTFLTLQKPEWSTHYVLYDVLKQIIKEGINKNKKQGKDGVDSEDKFMKQFNHEFKKVNQFCITKFEEIQNCLLTQVRSLIQNKDQDLDIALKKVDQISQDIIDLDYYVQVNEVAFRKIIKKYDKRFKRTVKQWIFQKLEQETFHNLNLSVFLVPLSELYECISLYKKGMDKQDQWVPPTTFERSTTKYWVKTGDLMKLKIEILKHVPILVFKRKKFFQDTLDLLDLESLSKWIVKTQDSAAISSVYLDDEKMSHYHARLQREEGSQLFRFRWYGTPRSNDENHMVFSERKEHHESWVSENSRKERVNLKWKNVESYMKKEWMIDKMVSKAVREGKMTKQDAEKSIQLSMEIQEHLVKQKLKPMVRTVYNRCAFQLNNSNAVRISIDTNLKFNNEDLEKKSWCLDKPSNVLEFPYCIFEVKLQEECPEWLQGILSKFEANQSIIPVYKFSKFTQACVVYHSHKLKLLPHWMDEKHEELKELMDRTNKVRSMPLNIPVDVIPERIEKTPEPKKSMDVPRRGSRISTTELNKINGEEEVVPEGQYESYQEDQPLLYIAKKVNFWESLWGLMKQAGSKTYNFVYSRGAAPKKFMPTKIEPKTFFANERTFMGWLSVSLTIQTMALLLVNFNQRVPAMIMFPFSILFMIYALYTYFWRMFNIEKKNAVAYHDRCGPPILVIVLLTAVFISYVVVFYQDWSRRHYTVWNNGNECQMIKSDISLASLNGITIKDDFIFATSSFELIQIPLNGSRARRISLPNWELTAITNDPSHPHRVILGLDAPNEIILFDFVQRKRISTYSITHFKQLDGISWSEKSKLLYAAPSFGGIVGFHMDHKNSTLLGIRRIQPDVYLTDLYDLPAEQIKISEISVLEDRMFILLDLARKLVVLNLETGKIENTVEIPAVYKWKGIFVTRKNVKSEKFDVYLSSTYPSAIWRFDFDISYGFSKCAWA